MSQARIFWIAWCLMWALGWLLIGFFTLLLGWIMVPVSLLAILLPVGSPRRGPAMIQWGPRGTTVIDLPPRTSLPPPGWYPDPWNRQPLRYWDGRSWR